MSIGDHELAEGIYESLLTEELRRRLREVSLESDLRKVDDADLPHVLSRHVAEVVERALRAASSGEERVAIANGVLQQLESLSDAVAAPAEQLMRLSATPAPGVVALPASRPATPLADTALLTNAHGEPNLGAEVRAEIDSSNEVDLLCAFVKWHGLRLLEQELSRLRDRGARFRVITTTYMGATERSALDRLIREFGAEVKVQYDAARTRLHAKAWMFRRGSGFDTAFVGSSNLSRAAMLDGVEWNVRLSRIATPQLLEKFTATFETYWNDQSFEPYDPERDRDRLDDALTEARGGGPQGRVTISLSGLQVRPYPYQQEMLDSLDAERAVHGRHRNLIVAATGTGKTVVAALDYRTMCDSATARRPSLLFVAHRHEILDQSLRTYREVLAAGDFGELYVGGSRPERWQHVFASVQSLTSYGVGRSRLKPLTWWSLTSSTMPGRDIPAHPQPSTTKELLGLTATPERADGGDIRAYFDGRTAAELRLWDALAPICSARFTTCGRGRNGPAPDQLGARAERRERTLQRLHRE